MVTGSGKISSNSPYSSLSITAEAAKRGDVKQKNMVAGEGRNQHAPGDIGNLVTVRGIDGKKQLPQVSRPVTSPDTEEVKKVDKKLNMKKVVEGSSKKHGQTFTSTLTASSKAAAFGLSKKPKEIIDAADANNELAAVEYVADMYKFYKFVEIERRISNYIESQPKINEKMRSILVDWLIEVHKKFDLMLEALYLTINIVDRYLATNAVAWKELQLLGISSMLTASKSEEIWAPEVTDFTAISENAYTNQQVLLMEKKIIGGLNGI